jgi:hypothetical protein
LKNAKLRATLANQDSCTLSASELTTCQYYCHVLNQYTDAELKCVVECAVGKKKYGYKSDVISTYKEVQIHGDILFERDIQSLFYHSEELGTAANKTKCLQLLEEFHRKFKVDYIEIQLQP